MQRLFADPVVRLFLRALVVAAIAFSSKFFIIDPSGGHISYQSSALTAAAVGALLAFAETFTPLNNLVGVFKGLGNASSVAVLQPPTEPPGDDGTEAPTVAKK